MIKKPLPTLVYRAKCLYLGATFSAGPFQLFSICLLHSFVIIILELPSLLLPKPPAERLQLEAAVRLLQFRCQTKIVLKMDMEFMKKVGKRYIVGAR